MRSVTPDEIGSTRGSSGSIGLPAGLRRWLIAKEGFFRALCVIASYVSGTLCLISTFALGSFGLISGIFGGIFVASLSILFAPSRLRHRHR